MSVDEGTLGRIRSTIAYVTVVLALGEVVDLSVRWVSAAASIGDGDLPALDDPPSTLSTLLRFGVGLLLCLGIAAYLLGRLVQNHRDRSRHTAGGLVARVPLVALAAASLGYFLLVTSNWLSLGWPTGWIWLLMTLGLTTLMLLPRPTYASAIEVADGAGTRRHGL